MNLVPSMPDEATFGDGRPESLVADRQIAVGVHAGLGIALVSRPYSVVLIRVEADLIPDRRSVTVRGQGAIDAGIAAKNRSRDIVFSHVHAERLCHGSQAGACYRCRDTQTSSR